MSAAPALPLYGWVGGAPVYVSEVRDQFNRQLEAIQRQTGQRPEPEQALRFGLHVRALEEVIQRAVLDYAIQQFGLTVSDAEVRAAIARNPAFQGTGGSFDPLLFRNRLQQARIGEAQFVADTRREIAAGQLFAVVRSDGLSPKSLRDDIFRLESEKRVADTIYVPDAIVVDVPKPTAEQLNAYFEANKTKFQIPEYRAFSYILLTVDDVLPQISVSADQVKQEYDARAAEFGTPEKRDVDQAMADTEDKAKAIIAAAAAAGKSLEDAAKEVLGSADGVIKLGPVDQEGTAARPAGRRHLRPARRHRAGADPVAARLACRAHQQDRARQGGAVRRGQGEAREGHAGAAGARPPDQAGHRFRAHAGQDPVDEGRRRGSRPQGQDLRERRRARHGRRRASRSSSAPPPPSWSRPPSPRAKVPRAISWKPSAANTSSCGPTASRLPASLPSPRSNPRSSRHGRPRNGASSPTPR